MKIIVLDIDGVLNSKNFFLNCKVDSKLDPNCITLLNNLIEETGAKLIISSSWRLTYSREELKQIFKDNNIKGKIVGFTRTYDIWGLGPAPRGVEIDEMIKNMPSIEKYIILDDEDDMLYKQRNHFFQVDSEYGLTKDLVSKAIKYLK